MITGLYVGRFNPLHNGHIVIINQMIDTHGIDNCIVFIGSCTESKTLLNIFSYQERRAMLKSVFPNIKVVGIPDFPNNTPAWFSYMSDIVSLKTSVPLNKSNYIFWGGSHSDIFYAIDAGYNHKVCNRYESELKLSSSEIKNRLILKESIDDYVHSDTIHLIQDSFSKFWDNKYNR